MGCNFANGNGYVLHSLSRVNDAKRGIIRLAMDVFGENDDLIRAYARPQDIHWSHIAHLLDGCRWGNGSAGRIYCIDAQGREWGQPYFALNEGKGKDICLEDRR